MADLFSLKLFGPAAIFALHEIPILTGSFDDLPSPDEFYPPWRMRLREVLSETNWAAIEAIIKSICTKDVLGISRELKDMVLQHLSERMSLLLSVTSIQDDQDNINKAVYLGIAYKSVAEALPKVREFLVPNLALIRVLKIHPSGRTFFISLDAWTDIYRLMKLLTSMAL